MPSMQAHHAVASERCSVSHSPPQRRPDWPRPRESSRMGQCTPVGRRHLPQSAAPVCADGRLAGGSTGCRRSQGRIGRNGAALRAEFKGVLLGEGRDGGRLLGGARRRRLTAQGVWSRHCTAFEKSGMLASASNPSNLSTSAPRSAYRRSAAAPAPPRPMIMVSL